MMFCLKPKFLAWQHAVASSVLVAALCPLAQAQGGRASWAQDVASGQDHPLIQRFNDSWLAVYGQQAYDSTTFPSQLALDKHNQFLNPVSVEGRITRLVYLAPLGKTPLEVQRNYEQALKGAGFQTLLTCTPKVITCAHMRFAFDDHYGKLKEADWPSNRERHPDGSALGENMRHLGGINTLGSDDTYLTYGTLTRNGQTIHVMVHTAKVYRTDFTSTYLEIAEPQAMKTGQVTVNAEALQAGLKTEGKMALYGIYFDTGKAEVKPESKAQLDEMATLLTRQPSLKVYLVGHTDNQGPLESNLSLSWRRAQAVAETLVKTYRIDASRVVAKGVANLAPVTSNEAESGRARNRRVELVAQ